MGYQKNFTDNREFSDRATPCEYSTGVMCKRHTTLECAHDKLTIDRRIKPKR